MSVETLQNEPILDFKMGRIIPEIVEFPGILLEIIELSEILVMVERELETLRPVHGGETAATARIMGVDGNRNTRKRAVARIRSPGFSPFRIGSRLRP